MRSALVVDDSVTWAERISGILREHDYAVTVCHDALEAAANVRKEPPDLLVTDYFLANLDGEKLCRLVKKSGGTKTRRTIIVTGGLDGAQRLLNTSYADVVVAKNRVDVFAKNLSAVLVETPAGQSDRGRIVGQEGLHSRDLVTKVYGLKAYVEALQEAIADAVIGVDQSLRLISLNSRASEFFGITEDEGIATPIQVALGIEDIHPVMYALRELQRDPTKLVRPVLADFAKRSLRISIAPISGGKERDGFLLLAHDLTDVKAAEAERLAMSNRIVQGEKLAALGTLTAGIAHEINNPLAALVPNLQLIQSAMSEWAANNKSGAAAGAALDEVPAMIAECIEAAERIHRITKSMTKHGHAGTPVRRSAHVETVLDSSANLIESQARSRVRVIRDYGATPAIALNETELGQAFLNVLVNALQAVQMTANPDPWIRIRTASEAGGIAVSIENNGPPIPPELKHKIFEPFFTTKGVGEGTGLGLSITHDMILRHGGYVEARNKPDAPTCFYFWLPLKTGDVQKAPSDTPAARRGLRLLVVDDESLILRSYQRIFAARHQLAEAHDGLEALAIIERDQDFDLIVCDLLMPRMSGIGLYRELEKRFPKLVSRVVFVTGGTMDEEARKFLEMVPNKRAYKPLQPNELLELVDQNAAAAKENKS
jgi:PAS domain S-box-containing protein